MLTNQILRGLYFHLFKLDLFCGLRFQKYNKQTVREECEIVSYIITKSGDRKSLWYHKIKGNLNQVWKRVDIKRLVRPR